MARAFIVPEDWARRPARSRCAARTNFQTPAGWDTVYTPIFNMIERPVAPMLVVRVETDWYPHETEFRYVLQPGEGMSLGPHPADRPGVFVPREEIALRDGTDKERSAFHATMDEFSAGKAASRQTTPYGLPVSPHYLRLSRQEREKSSESG